MKAFDIQGDQVTFTAEFLGVPEFKVLWNRDRTKGKSRAIKELSYVTFLCDNTVYNPYMGYSEDIREEVLIEDFIGDKTWKPDTQIQEAVEKLRKLLETTSSRLLKSSQIGSDKLSIYFEQLDFTLVDNNGKPVYSARELAANLSSIGSIIKSLKILEEQVRKEQLDDNIARGGSEIGVFELPNDDMFDGAGE